MKSPYQELLKNNYKKTKTKMSKKITLTISERVAIVKILNGFKGDLSVLAKLLDDMKKIAITQEEWVKAGLVKTPQVDEKGNPTGQETWNWQDKKETEKELELDSETTLYVQNEIKEKEAKKEITMQDVSLITLKAKL